MTELNRDSLLILFKAILDGTIHSVRMDDGKLYKIILEEVEEEKDDSH